MPRTNLAISQIGTENKEFPNFYQEFLNVRDRLTFLDETGEYDVLYEYDATGQYITKEFVYDNKSPRTLLKLTELTYTSSGAVKTEKVAKNNRKVLKTFNYDAAGNLIGVQVRFVS